MKIIVIGAGIIGASIAWNLSRAGAEMAVIDSGGPAATSASFGWINASFYADAAHHALRVASLHAYGRILTAVPDAPITMGGALWWEAQGAALHTMKASLEALAYPVEHLNQDQAQALEPDLTGLPSGVLRFPNEGWTEAAALARHLLRTCDARMISGVRVDAIAQEDGHVVGVETSIGRVTADRVIVAAGNGAPDILASVGVKLPMLTRPGVMVTTKPVRARINHVLVTPHGEVRQLPDGRLMASAVANHQSDDASVVTEQVEDIAARLLGWLEPMIPGERLVWDQVTLAYRPVPQDGLPVIGAVGPTGSHVAVMHSGVTLAAIVGEAMAAEVLNIGDFDALLSPYRPQRFQ